MPPQDFYVYRSPIELNGSFALDIPFEYQRFPDAVGHPPHSTVLPSNGIVSVLNYAPFEGVGGTLISVRILLHPGDANVTAVQLIVGDKAIATTFREIQEAPSGQWQLDAVVPPLDASPSLYPKVSLSVQAFGEHNAVIETVTFGEFSYWARDALLHMPRCIPSTLRDIPPTTPNIPKLHINTRMKASSVHSFHRHSFSHPPAPSSTSLDRSRVSSSPNQQVQLHRRPKLRSKVSDKGNGEDLIQAPILDFVTSLKRIGIAWTPAEISVGRRLVRFSKMHDGCRLIVSCEPVRAEEYHESDNVISCIYCEAFDTCYVTSVDIIFLLERLTNNDFPVQEKNRIRRNLEGLRPTTVSRYKPGFEEFFQRIMDYPDPKPRSIEKHLKVFEWSLLDQALAKILSKYTIKTSSRQTESTEASGELSSSRSLGLADQQGYSVKIVEKPPPFLDVVSVVLPPPQDEFHLLTSPGVSEETPPSVISPINDVAVAFPEINDGLYQGFLGCGYAQESLPPAHFPSYEATRDTSPIIHYPTSDFSTYETLRYYGSVPDNSMITT
ncbi:hypothetical protein Hypma_008546 [Hypsizygus marmoreus]|uniref:DUF7082 domain-containing protein n=1 Tax=Hypsizygus marmoreus TaxID=39966 RepID=A0A369JPE1_HYPMA|nr:hypothetical protein Hypma_008546 [Hypsizygus marmoreus]